MADGSDAADTRRTEAGEAAPGGRIIPAGALRHVIRRAAELSLAETDPAETLSEDEVVRIATELGLPPQHVRRAVFELPELSVARRWYDRWFDPAVVTMARSVPSRRDPVARRIEDYLVTREYLQIVRRRSDSLAFMPADDTLSNLARALSRPNSRHLLSRSSRVLVGVHALPDDTTHVRFDIDMSKAREDSAQAGAIVGGGLGLAIGTGAAFAAGALVPVLGPVPEILGFTLAAAGTVAGSVRIAANSFRERVAAAQLELNGLLDRLEHGGRLDPPPAPWRRRLQLKLFGE